MLLLTKFGNGSKIGGVYNVMTVSVGYIVTWADEPGSHFSTDKYQICWLFLQDAGLCPAAP